MKRSLNFILVVIVFALGLSSCAITYLPVKKDGITIAEDFAISNLSDQTIAVKSTYWSKEPTMLSSLYSVYYISIKNISENKITVFEKNFSLLDENRNQLDIISKNDIIQMISYQDSDFDNLLIPPEERRAMLERRMNSRKNLEKYIFNFGDIMPNATKSGYIFFQDLDLSNSKCTFIYNEVEIEFQKIK